MESSLFRQITELVREHKTAARAMAVFLCLALIVAATTVGVLTYTGQAMTQKVKVLTCPLVVHQHTDECYDPETGELICASADYVVHVHNDDCYDEDGVLVCSLPEIKPHVHEDDCYGDVKVPVCGQEEAKGHEHTEACYDRQRGELICTQQEHTHGADCFLREEVLTCDKTEQEHIHSDDCYTVSRDLTCGQEESEEHTHSDDCYTEVRTLTCDKTTEPHVHGPECYTVNETLICEIPEHTHSDDCYAWTETLICDIPEGQIPEGGHVHTEACFETRRELTCGKLENHTHTDDCYAHDEDGNRIGLPICGKIELLEHVHGEDCFTIEERTVEDQKPSTGPLFFQMFETGDVEAVCGKEEHTHDASCLDENGQIVCGKEEHTHEDSCYSVTWEPAGTPAPELVNICGLEEHVHDASCIGEGNELICGKIEHIHDESCLGYAETPEEPVYYCGLAEHTHTDACLDENGQLICGFVEHTHSDDCLVPPPVYYCGLAEHTHTDACLDENGQLICGCIEHTHGKLCTVKDPVFYCGLEEHTHEESCLDANGRTVCGKEEHTHTDECLVPVFTQTAETENIRVTAKYGPEANIPEGAVLKVERIPEDDEHYDERLSDLGTINNQLNGEALIPMALLNMGFFTEDGTEVEPAAPVTVTFQFLDDAGDVIGEVLRIVHFADTGVEMMETTPVDEALSASFETNGFSDLWVTTSVETVDGGIMLTAGDPTSVYSDFDHNKRIDFLGDDDNNPDTGVDDKGNADGGLSDLYRLYLDMEGKSKPSNLLFIIDRSSSMNSTMDGVRRDVTLANILMGQNGQKGIIEQFLERNKGKADDEKSYVAGVWFGGEYNNTGGYAGIEHYFNASGKDIGNNKDGMNPSLIGGWKGQYTKDAGPVFSWTNTYSSNLLKCTEGTTSRETKEIGALPQVEGTNYCAGLLAAASMLDSLPDDAKNNETIVIFLSDGLPTYFIQADSYKDGRDNKNVWRYGEALEDKSQVCAEGLRTTGGITVAMQYGFFSQTKLFFEKFRNEFSGKYPSFHFFTVGIGVGGDLSLRQERYGKFLTSDEKKVKNYSYDKKGNLLEDYKVARSYSVMIDMGEGGMKEATTASALEQTLKEIVFPSGVTITDELSAYVELYGAKPDVLVTATNKKTGEKIELWKGNSVSGNVYGQATGTNTVAGVGPVVQSVTVSGKIVTLTFDPNYCLSGDYTYTLSFNVKLTETAFDYFAEHDGSYKVGDDETQGDTGTDYGENKTSSGRPGLHSNSSAYVDYSIDGQRGHITYKHPVVQPWGSYLTLIKKDDSDPAKPLPGIAFKLVRNWKDEAGRDKSANIAPSASGEDTVTSEDIGGADAAGYYFTDTNGKIAYNMLEHGEYTLYEYVPPEYEGDSSLDLNGGEKAGPRKVAEFTVSRGRIVVEDKEGDDIAWTLGTDRSWPNTKFGANGEITLTLTNRKVERQLEIWKMDDPDGADLDGADLYLNGAEFTLYHAEAIDGGYKSTGKKVEGWEEPKVSGEFEPGKPGLVFSGKLPYGLYALEETNAPANYHKLKGTIYFKVDANGVTMLKPEVEGVELTKVEGESVEKDTFTLTVTDKKIKVEAHLKKVDGSTKDKGIPGAEFSLYSSDYVPEGVEGIIERLFNTVEYKTEGTLLWRGESDADGFIKGTGEYKGQDFPVLEAGKTYYLVETKAPAGYSGLAYTVRLTVGKDGHVEKALVEPDHDDWDEVPSGEIVNVVDEKDESGNLVYSVTITISNYNGYELPESGGEGRVPLYAVGFAMIVLSAALLERGQRRRKEERV